MEKLNIQLNLSFEATAITRIRKNHPHLPDSKTIQLEIPVDEIERQIKHQLSAAVKQILNRVDRIGIVSKVSLRIPITYQQYTKGEHDEPKMD